MLKSIYSYELKSLLKQPAIYFYFVVFFGILDSFGVLIFLRRVFGLWKKFSYQWTAFYL